MHELLYGEELGAIITRCEVVRWGCTVYIEKPLPTGRKREFMGGNWPIF